MNDKSLTRQWIGFDQSKFKIGTCYALKVSGTAPDSLRQVWQKFIGRELHAILCEVSHTCLQFKFLAKCNEEFENYMWYDRDVTIQDFMSNMIVIRELS